MNFVFDVRTMRLYYWLPKPRLVPLKSATIFVFHIVRRLFLIFRNRAYRIRSNVSLASLVWCERQKTSKETVCTHKKKNAHMLIQILNTYINKYDTRALPLSLPLFITRDHDGKDKKPRREEKWWNSNMRPDGNKMKSKYCWGTNNRKRHIHLQCIIHKCTHTRTHVHPIMDALKLLFFHAFSILYGYAIFCCWKDSD